MSLPVAVQGGGSRNEERAGSYIKNISMKIKPISLALYYGFMTIQQQYNYQHKETMQDFGTCSKARATGS